MSKNKKRILWIFVGIIAAVAISLIPVNSYVESPGGAYNVGDYLKVKNRKNTNKPNFYFTAVTIRPAFVLDYATILFQKYHEIIPKQEIDGDLSREQSDVVDEIYMANSVNDAKLVAATAANIPHQQKFAGVYVMNVAENSDFYQRLKVGDLILSIDNQQFLNTKDLISYVGKKAINDKVTVEIKRDNKIKKYRGKVMKISKAGQHGIGISLIAKESVATTPEVDVDTQNIGGPSAGLMFSLGLYQEFTNKKLFDGQKVAGTGTIDAKGHVGSIGGIDKKVVSAAKSGAKIFFCPKEVVTGEKKSDSNYATAQKTAKDINTKMKIIPVNNFSEALNYLTQQK